MPLQGNISAPLANLPGTANTGQIEDGAVTLGKLSASLQDRVVHVRESPYDAKGDGTTDDCLSIQNAIQALVTASPPGGILRIPKGVYAVKGVAAWCASALSRGDILIQGDGPGQTILKQHSNALYNILAVVDTSQAIRNVGITGITFQGFEPPSDDSTDPDTTK